MYERFFGFSEKPFALTPNTRLYYMSEQHDAALRLLAYGIESRAGFLVLSGPPGSGKTTTIRALAHAIGDSVPVSMILNPLLTTGDLVKSIVRDFGLVCYHDSIHEHLEVLNRFLLDLKVQNKTAVVIIDEAQNLSPEALEMTRMLSNLETEDDKLINILLVGQDQIEATLKTPEFRQLAQRIQVHARLQSLTEKETEQYIQTRLDRTGASGQVHFGLDTVKHIYKSTKGIPRLINRVCDLSLMAAYSHQTHIIDKKLVKKACEEVMKYVAHS